MTFPNFEDWKAPWEADGEELDPDKVKKLVYNLKKSETEHKEQLGDKDAKIQERDDALKAYREAEEAAKREAETDAEKAARERAETEKAVAKQAAENELLKLRLETGLSEADAQRVVGSTFEEKLEDAKALAERLKPAEKVETDEEKAAREEAERKAAEDADDGGDDLDDVVRRAPVVRKNTLKRVDDPDNDVREYVRGKSSTILAN